MNPSLITAGRYLGIQSASSRAEKFAASIGGTISIAAIFYFSSLTTGYAGAMAILPSMGAAAVLLFAVPHGPLSQPWALFAGNLLSALIGVSCALLAGNIYLAAALAVGLSIALMHICRCIHPPGGATALAAVIGGEALHNLGYWYVVTPTLINCMILFVVAVLINSLFPWRRYPLASMPYRKAVPGKRAQGLELQHIRAAREAMDTVLDVSDEQLKRLVDTAFLLKRNEKLRDFVLEPGAFYSNGAMGRAWSVRQVIDEAPHANPDFHMVIYRTVEGYQKHRSDSCTLEEFADWAREKLHPVGR